MTHTEFMAERQTGEVELSIDNSTAIRLIEHLPGRYRSAHSFWTWVWILSIPGFICVSIFVKWWIGLLLLFFITPLISSSIKMSAAQFVVKHALENETFFNLLATENMLVFKRKRRT